MEPITIISVMAALTTISLAFYALYRRFKRNWQTIQHKIDNLENSLHVNQRVYVTTDIVVPYKKKLLIIEKDSKVELLSVNTSTGIVTIRAMKGLLTTTTHIDNIMVDREDL